MSKTPENLKYTLSHEWTKLEEDGTLTVGITEHAQQLLGDLVFVELPEPGQQLKAGSECCVVESVKAASDVYAPLSGEIIAVNQALINAPDLVNSDPYGKGWLFQLRPSNTNELSALLTAESYNKQVADEAH